MGESQGAVEALPNAAGGPPFKFAKGAPHGDKGQPNCGVSLSNIGQPLTQSPAAGFKLPTKNLHTNALFQSPFGYGTAQQRALPLRPTPDAPRRRASAPKGSPIHLLKEGWGRRQVRLASCLPVGLHVGKRRARFDPTGCPPRPGMFWAPNAPIAHFPLGAKMSHLPSVMSAYGRPWRTASQLVERRFVATYE
uniref:Uncharacterized protein n=1 Tax=Trichuris muris TaxID=70415 RepID=A0A5S6QYC6_TRIMR